MNVELLPLQRLAEGPDRATAALGTADLHDDVVHAYRDHHLSLLRFASLVAPEDGMAEDLVQEAFIRLYKAQKPLEDRAKLPAYLRTTIVNLARGRRRRMALARRRTDDPVTDAAPAELGALRRQEQERVVQALRDLPERQRSCLVLRHYEDRSESEIAAILGISVGSVRTHVHRGKAALQRTLGEK